MSASEFAFKDNQTRWQLFTLAYNLANFLRRHDMGTGNDRQSALRPEDPSGLNFRSGHFLPTCRVKGPNFRVSLVVNFKVGEEG
jgi:hypothetical protein